MFEAGIKREELFITTKLWNTDKGDAEAAFNLSLSKLGLEYVDLYLIHNMVPVIDFESDDWSAKSPPHHVIWKVLEEQVKKGKIRSIGVSNFTVPALLDLIAGAEINPTVNQIECHPFLQQQALFKWHKKLGVAITCYAAIGSGHYSGNEQVKSVSVLTDPIINEIAEKHGKSAAQVAVQFQLQRQSVVVLVKTTKIERLAENLKSAFFTLDEEDVEKIEKLDAGLRLFNPRVFD